LGALFGQRWAWGLGLGVNAVDLRHSLMRAYSIKALIY
jgi:hypothetical protein